ncbi:MAG: methylated-DNA--[protein]-cysteine S-methyltransferase [Actinomycetota bacterium]
MNAVIDVAWHLQGSPLGELLVAATDEGVCLVEWGDPSVALRSLEIKTGAPARRSSSLHPVGEQLDSFFAGERRSFDVPLDLSWVSAFCRRVLERLARVPFGVLTTYGSLAAAVSSAPRAVGRAVGSNPVPVLVPCHRVVAADGTLGGFGGGLDRKRLLLSLEGHEALPGGWPARRSDGQR